MPPSVIPVILKSFPLLRTVTWDDVKSSIFPLRYSRVYFSASYGSKNTLVIPELLSNASEVFTSKTPDPFVLTLAPVNCLLYLSNN